MRKKSKKAYVPRVGLFFVVDGKPIVDGLPWTEVPSLAGFRTSALGHPEFWARLQQGGVVPQGMPYEDCPRGRVNRFDATGRFTLLADRCIIKSKPMVRKIMAALGLPRGTAVVRDLHYRCAVCLGKVPTRKQEKDDWDFSEAQSGAAYRAWRPMPGEKGFPPTPDRFWRTISSDGRSLR